MLCISSIEENDGLYTAFVEEGHCENSDSTSCVWLAWSVPATFSRLSRYASHRSRLGSGACASGSSSVSASGAVGSLYRSTFHSRAAGRASRRRYLRREGA